MTTINYTTFTEDSGAYYTSAFITKKDKITIFAELSGNGTVSVQSSINGMNWFDVSNTEISCSPLGQESFVDCQEDLQYRTKSSVEPTSIIILL